MSPNNLLKKGTKILYKDYDDKIIEGVISDVGFKNKNNTIVWYSVDFGYKGFLVPKEEIINKEVQLNLFS